VFSGRLLVPNMSASGTSRHSAAAGDSPQPEANRPQGRWPLRSDQMAAILPESPQDLGNGRSTAAAVAVASSVPSGRRRLPCRWAVALPMRKTSPRPITRDMGVGRR
jgi:hypothetical protein